MLRKFFREYLRHFHFQTSGNCRHQTFLFSTIRSFQTSDTLFSNLIYFQRSDVFIFKHQIFQNIWHFYFQTLDIFKQLTLYFQTLDMLKHLTFVFSNLRYFQKSDIFIFNTRSSNFFVVSLALQSGEGRFCWQLKPCWEIKSWIKMVFCDLWERNGESKLQNVLSGHFFIRRDSWVEARYQYFDGR